MNCTDCNKNVRGILQSTRGAFCSLCGVSVFSLKFPQNEREDGCLIVNISKLSDCDDLIFRLPISVLKLYKPGNKSLSFDDIQNRKLIDIKKCNLKFDNPEFENFPNSLKTIELKNTNNKNIPNFEVTVKDFFNYFLKKISSNSFSFNGKFNFNFARENIEKKVLFMFFKSWPPITAKPFPYLAGNPIIFQDTIKKTLRFVLFLNNENSHSVHLKKLNNVDFFYQ